VEARTVLWAAGVEASPLARSLGCELDEAGRVPVEPDLSVPGHPEVFVAGDLAVLEQDGEEVPGMAPAAKQMGRHAARQVRRRLRGEETEAFRYRDKGMLATLGRSRAVARIGGRHFSGMFAWLVWLAVHVLYLVGFRNRAAVLLGWASAYLTYGRGARVILSGPIEGAEARRAAEEEAAAGASA